MNPEIRSDAVRWLNALLDLNDGDTPFPWQKNLLSHLLRGQLHRRVDVPTGLGKTAIIAIWLAALAAHVKAGDGVNFPRRIAYVVNRRTVVDQATVEAENLRRLVRDSPELVEVKNLLGSLAVDPDSSPLAISTLRGEFADNGEWRNDPARPAIIVGTVDMIGSRLLFSGYGRCGFKSKPVHAGLLGQDTLILHDEAHLEPAFQSLLEAIEAEQRRQASGSRLADSRALHVMALSATARTSRQTKAGQEEPLFSNEDETHEVAAQRLRARKWLDFHHLASDRELASQVAGQAMAFRDSGGAILIFLRRVKDVEDVARELRKEKVAVETLTGTQRGWERDQLTRSNSVFARFLPPRDRNAEPSEGTVYLVCTSAGEIGVNLSADHLVCDVTPLDSMIQRFGRVNRFGNGDARIEVIHFGRPANDARRADANEVDESGKPAGDVQADSPRSGRRKEAVSSFDLACERTFAVLRSLPSGKDGNGRGGRLASPAALRQILDSLSAGDRRMAFTPEPVISPATDILFDAWALTTVSSKLPGRPPVADWLHGLSDWEPPETHVAWRDEVTVITGELLETYTPGAVIEDYPLKPHELLRDRSERVFEQLKKIAARAPNMPAWLVDRDDKVSARALAELAEEGTRVIEHATVILPPIAGGLSGTGLLDGSIEWDQSDGRHYDLADKWMDSLGQPRRCRFWNETYKPRGMRLVRRVDLPVDAGADEDNEPETRSWCWYVQPRFADDDGSRGARRAQELGIHLDWTAQFADRLVRKLGVEPHLARVIVLAARWHDLGKKRRIWQRSIGNIDPGHILAKSGPGMRPLDGLTRYRHEFGSLFDVADDEEFKQLDLESRDLVLHLIAAHHGRARPHFPLEEAFDPDNRSCSVRDVAVAVPQRFARLQRYYGRWGLAWLESLVRAADAMASNAIHGSDDEGEPQRD